MEKSLLDVTWLLIASGLVFFMQAGFAMVESGLTRSKNNINVAIKNLSDFGISLILFWLIGFPIMFGFGVDTTTMWGTAFLLFQAMFCSTAATIVSGAVAERMKFSSYLIWTIAMSIIVYPVFGQWAWGGAISGGSVGWLASLGFVDFAGSSVVHSLGGWVSLGAILVIGARSGRFPKNGEAKTIPGSNIPMAVLGVFVLWFGWIGFNGGSTLAANSDVPGIILRTMLGGAGGMIGALIIGWPIRKYPDISLVINGSLAGLVAITANCHAINSTEAIIIGLIGGIIMFLTSELLTKLKIDDAVDAIPVHLAAGIWGTLAVGIFGHADLLKTGLGQMQQIGIQALGIVVCGAWALGTSFIGLWILNRINTIRISEKEEYDGLNMSEHRVNTEINELFKVMNDQAETGDLKLRAPIEPFTEAGQIGKLYNSVLDTLLSQTIEKTEYLDILAHIGDGVCTIERDFRIGNYYSKALSDIFEKTDLASQNLLELLEKYNFKVDDNLKDFVNLAFDHEKSWRHLSLLNPLKEIEINIDNGQGEFRKKNIQAFFTRIYKNGVVEKLLILFKDITHELEMAKEIEETRREGSQEIELLHNIIHLDAASIREFLVDFKSQINSINEILKNGKSNIEIINSIFTISHKLKGDSELLGLVFIVNQVEKLEELSLFLRTKSDLKSEDFLPLAIACSDLIALEERLSEILQKWAGISLIAPQTDHVFREAIENMVERLSEKYKKNIKVKLNFDIRKLSDHPSFKSFRSIIIQCIRNSIYHGIEKTGNILVDFKNDQDSFSLSIRDDGKGIDHEKIRLKLIEKNLKTVSEAEKLTKSQLITSIFKQGLSTAEKSDEIAGKGVGLNLVEKLVQELQAKIIIKTEIGKGTEFIIQKPRIA